LTRQITTYSTGAYLYDSHDGDLQSVTFYENYSNYGRAWRWQDKILGGTARSYNSHYGTFNIYFEFVTTPPTNSVTQYYGTYVHSWNTTAVNSIGIGPYSASIGWTNEGKGWSDADQWVYDH